MAFVPIRSFGCKTTIRVGIETYQEILWKAN